LLGYIFPLSREQGDVEPAVCGCVAPARWFCCGNGFCARTGLKVTFFVQRLAVNDFWSSCRLMRSPIDVAFFALKPSRCRDVWVPATLQHNKRYLATT
jgi:hypothetical protein